jgi:cell fate regulator YaaT (PSP1 superfamily)
MPKVVSVRFHDAGKICRYDPAGLSLHIGDAVIAENAQCLDLGHVTEEIFDLPDEKISEPLKPVIRMANEADLKRYEEKKVREKEAFGICQEKIVSHELSMNLVDVQYSFDGKKLVFYFTADNRVDFRELVKDLAAVFRTRIELRQIGVRDQARMVGGLGLCGRELCCCSFLHDFVPVSVKMVKEQGLSMNPAKISGSCGRLMCCLKYEQDAYEDAHARLPSLGDVVRVSQGRGTVVSLDILHERLTIRLDTGEDADLLVVPAEEAEVLSPKNRKGAQAPCKSSDGKKRNCPCKKDDAHLDEDMIDLEE